jgi:hypothetical protein
MNVGGKSLHDALGDVIGTQQYKAATDSTADYKGSKKMLSEAVISEYRHGAAKLLTQENPAVAQALTNDTRARVRALTQQR